MVDNSVAMLLDGCERRWAGCNGQATFSLSSKQTYDKVRRLFYNGLRHLSIGKAKRKPYIFPTMVGDHALIIRIYQGARAP